MEVSMEVHDYCSKCQPADGVRPCRRFERSVDSHTPSDDGEERRVKAGPLDKMC